MIVGGQTEARAQLSSTIIDYHEPFDQGFKGPQTDFRALPRKWNVTSGDWRHDIVSWPENPLADLENLTTIS